MEGKDIFAINSIGFPSQEYWSGLTFPSLGDLPNPEIKPESPTLQADYLPPEPQGKPCVCVCVCIYILDLSELVIPFAQVTASLSTVFCLALQR